MYHVKNVKTFKGMDGGGFNCSLYKDGKKIAECIDSGCGGEVMFHWMDFKAPKIKRDIPNIYVEGKISHVSFTPEENEFHQVCARETFEILGKIFPKTPDVKVEELINEFENTKRLKRMCKTKTLFRVKSKSYQDGEWMVLKIPFTPKVKEHIITKYGNCIILNETI